MGLRALSRAYRAPCEAGESWRTRTDTELSEPLEVSPLQTHAALQTKAFTKAFMGLNERRLTSKEPERAVAPARPVLMSQMKLATTLERAWGMKSKA